MTHNGHKRARVLIVDDDRALGEMLAEELGDDGYLARYVQSSREASSLLEEPFDVLVTDLRMPAIDGLGLLERSRAAAPQRPVIVMTAFSAVESAIESIRQGAYHYLTKPFKVDELEIFVERALAEAELKREAIVLRRALAERVLRGDFVAESAAMRETAALIVHVADASTPVLLLGETGVGKGVLARALHTRSKRASGAFVTVNCAALPEHLLESELFGHARGAFTGATTSRVGLLEEASGGTLFLDEIGEMPVALQAKLLHVIESNTIRPLGTNKEKLVDVRVVAATHRDLERRVTEGQFREDLLFRLNVITIEVPALRSRKDDFAPLVAYFIEQARERHPHSPVRSVSAAAFEKLLAHRWPGNVRELANVIERLVLLGAHEEVGVADLPRALNVAHPPAPEFSGEVQPLDKLERRYAQWALDQLGGRKMVTAERLEIDRKTLARLLDDDT